MKRLLIAAACAAFVAAGSVAAGLGGGGVEVEFTTQTSVATVTVSGKVLDAETGEAIPKAQVRGHIAVWRQMGPHLFEDCPYQITTSDTNGDYQLTFKAALTTSGTFKGKDNACVYASKPGYETRPVYVKPRVTHDMTEFTGVDIALGPGRHLTGKVLDEEGRPIAQAVVRARNNMNGDWNQFGALGLATTDENGTFEMWITGEKGKEHTPNRLDVLAPGYGFAHVYPLESEDLGDIVIARGGTVGGRIVGWDGAGIEGAEVRVADGHNGTLATAVTDADGHYELTGLRTEEVVKEYFAKRGYDYRPTAGEVTVCVRTDTAMPLKEAPQFKVVARQGQTVAADEFIVGGEASVSGRLLAGANAFSLKGLMVRLDYDWSRMVEADAAGEFIFPYVAPGKHRLTAYLPNNLRGDRGIGRAEITVEPRVPVEGVTIDLETLSEIRVQFVDSNGNPLEGITAGATWSADGSGFWTEGTKSGADGWAVLYLYPGSLQYVRGFDHSERNLVAAAFKEVTPREGEVIDFVRIAMVEAAGITGKFVDEAGAPVAGKRVSLALSYADGSNADASAETDKTGAFTVKPRLKPGIVTLSAETIPLEFKGASAAAVEVAPGGVTDLGVISLRRVPFYKVGGKVVSSPTVTKIDGLKIRLNLTGPWQFVGETDAEGRFEVEVPEGEHRLTAYVPWNLRFDPGIGHVEVKVTADLEGVELPLDSLAVIRMTIVDQNGAPLEGMSGITTFREDMSGPGNEGPPSDENGLSTIYVYPGHDEYAAPFDKSRKLRWKEVTKVNLEEGDVVEITGVLVPAEEE